LVEPEVVATSPCPGKNRMPVCCGFDSDEVTRGEWLVTRGQRAIWPSHVTCHLSLPLGAHGGICTCTGDALDVVPLRWATRASSMEPPAGAAPARSLYKSAPQSAARRRNGRSPRCRPGRGGLMKPT